MFELVVMVCLVTNQNQCEEFRVRGTEAENIAACMKSASVKAEEWRTKNDDYFIIGVRCAKDSKSSFAPGDKS
jgi:hypothetical protein